MGEVIELNKHKEEQILKRIRPHLPLLLAELEEESGHKIQLPTEENDDASTTDTK